MPKTPDFEAEKAALRERQRQHLAEQRAAEDQQHDQMVRTYWDKRAKDDPDDPEVLRARADLIAKDRGLPGNNGVTVAANPTNVAAEAGNA